MQNIAKNKSLIRNIISTLESYKADLIKHDKLINLVSLYTEAGYIIDIGCGNGSVINRLERKFRPFGIEISKEQARAANLIALARGWWVVPDKAINGLKSFPRNHFDGAIMSTCLEHELNPISVLENTFAVLRTGVH